jgi:hypothetical protein
MFFLYDGSKTRDTDVVARQFLGETFNSCPPEKTYQIEIQNKVHKSIRA